MVVVLPAPFGPSRPDELAFLHHEVDAVERGEVAEALDEALGDDSLHAAEGTRSLANCHHPVNRASDSAVDSAPVTT